MVKLAMNYGLLAPMVKLNHHLIFPPKEFCILVQMMENFMH